MSQHVVKRSETVAQRLNRAIESSSQVLKSFNQVHQKHSSAPAGGGVGSGVHVKAQAVNDRSQDRS